MAAAGGRGVGKYAKGMKKTVAKVIHPPFIRTNIPAGQATPAPPLGTQLGQVRSSVICFFFGSMLRTRPSCPYLLALRTRLKARSDGVPTKPGPTKPGTSKPGPIV